jgi:hypothetical protein
MRISPRDRYVREILELYRTTPGTRGRIRPADRRLADDLYRRDIPAQLVRAALVLAASRRIFRDPELGHLEPIGSLRYFLPVLQELQRRPVDPDYIEYVEAKLADTFSTYSGQLRRFP